MIFFNLKGIEGGQGMIFHILPYFYEILSNITNFSIQKKIENFYKGDQYYPYILLRFLCVSHYIEKRVFLAVSETAY